MPKAFPSRDLPEVHEVTETVFHRDPNPNACDHNGSSFVIIAPDHASGRRHRYSVIRVSNKGTAVLIGSELDLPLARRVARRPESEDGLPVPTRTR